MITDLVALHDTVDTHETQKLEKAQHSKKPDHFVGSCVGRIETHLCVEERNVVHW